MAKKTPRPGRTLSVFFIVTALLYGAVVLGGSATAGESLWKPKLGLDLEGGTRITLTATKTPTATQLALARNIIDARANGSGVSESNVSTQGNRNIVVEIPGKNSTNLVNTVKRTALLRFRLVAGQPQQGRPGQSPSASPSASPSGTNSTAPSSSPSGAAPSGTTPKVKPSGSASATPKGRVAPKLDTTPTPSASGTPKPSPNASPSASPSASPTAAPSASPSSGTTSTGNSRVDEALAFQQNPDQASLAKLAAYQCPAKGKSLPPGADDPNQPLVTCDQNGIKYLLSKAVIEGTSLKSASYGQPQNSVAWAVFLNLKGGAPTRTFANISQKLVSTGGQFAIVLDGEVLSAPGFDSPIPDGRAQISGSFTQAETKSLSNSLKYGALPLRFDSTVDQVGPSLAGNQLSAGIAAGVIGLILVMLYCLLYYRGLGLVVVGSLVIAGVVTYGVVLALARTAGFTLTLPGIAGLIVAVGITADSFIVYFERIRDEMRSGKSMRVAVELGWARARNTCLAADAVSLLAAVVLYIFTIGVVRGFAFALGISTLIDLAVFFWFTKPSMTALARVSFFSSGHRLSGLSQETLGIDQGHHGMTGTAGGRA